jgi:hypothetical protein
VVLPVIEEAFTLGAGESVLQIVVFVEDEYVGVTASSEEDPLPLELNDGWR